MKMDKFTIGTLLSAVLFLVVGYFTQTPGLIKMALLGGLSGGIGGMLFGWLAKTTSGAKAFFGGASVVWIAQAVLALFGLF